MKKFISFLLVSLLSTSLAFGATIGNGGVWVNGVNADMGWDAGNVTYVPITGNINTYITNATAGDTLELAAGTYTLSTAITIPTGVATGVRLKGQGKGLTTITGAIATSMFVVQNGNFGFEDMTINNTRANGDRAITFDRTGAGIINTYYLYNVNVGDGGAVSGNIEGLVSFLDCGGILENVNIAATSSGAEARALDIVNASTAEAATTVSIRNSDISASGVASTGLKAYVNNAPAGGTLTVNAYDSYISGTGASGNRYGAWSARTTGTTVNLNIYPGSSVNGSTYDVIADASAGLTLHAGTELVNGTTSGTITYDGSVVTEDLYASDTVGIGNTAPTQALEIGSATAGKNQKINGTEGAELFSTFNVANWTLTAGWEATNDGNTQLNHNADGATTATLTSTAPTSGRLYKVVAVMNASVTGGVQMSYGGPSTGGNMIMNPTVGVPTTFTFYYKAVNATNIILTPATASRFVITSISIKEITAGTGDLTVLGDVYMAGKLMSPNSTYGIQVQPNGSLAVPAALSMQGAITGVTTLSTTGLITNAQTLSATTTAGMSLSTAAATVGTTVRVSPSLLFTGSGWNTTPTAASKGNSIEMYMLPTTGATTAGNLVIRNNTVDGVSNTTELMRITTGGNVGIGTSTPATTLNVLGNSVINNQAGNIDDDVVLISGQPRFAVVQNTQAVGDTAWFMQVGANANAANIYGSKTRATTTAADVIVQDNDALFSIIATGSDGAGRYRNAGSIAFEVDGTPGATDMPGRILFNTSADGGATPTERMRISNNGLISAILLNYGADAGSTDAYAVTIAGFTYTTGSFVVFKANTINTGACTLNINGVGAVALKSLHDQDPPDGYIEAGSMVTAVYDGTNWQIQTPDANP